MWSQHDSWIETYDALPLFAVVAVRAPAGFRSHYVSDPAAAQPPHVTRAKATSCSLFWR